MRVKVKREELLKLKRACGLAVWHDKECLPDFIELEATPIDAPVNQEVIFGRGRHAPVEEKGCCEKCNHSTSLLERTRRKYCQNDDCECHGSRHSVEEVELPQEFDLTNMSSNPTWEKINEIVRYLRFINKQRRSQ